MRSPRGASAALLLAARALLMKPLATVALAVEYEATCRLARHRVAAGFSDEEVGIFVDALLALTEPVEAHFLWRPQLRDPADELVLEASINGRAEALVTFNRRDFGTVPSRFGIEVLSPAETLRRIGT